MLRQTTNKVLRLCLGLKPFNQMNEIESKLLIDNIILLKEVAKQDYQKELKFVVCLMTGLNYRESKVIKPSSRWQKKLKIKTSYEKRSALMLEYYERLKDSDDIDISHTLKLINKILTTDLTNYRTN